MVVKRKSDYLAHHGIKGQSWGDQNGPPYPLDSQVSSAVKKKKSKSFIQKLKDKKKGKKLQAARKKKAEEKKEKEEIINSGDEKKIKKIQHKLTDEEYVRALNRIALNKKLKAVDYSNIEKKLQTVGVFANTVSNVGNAINSVANATNTVLNVKDRLSGKDKDPNSKLKTERERLSLINDIKALQSDNSDPLKDFKIERDKSSLLADIAKNQATIDAAKYSRFYAESDAKANVAKNNLTVATANAQIKGINTDKGKAYLNKLWSTNSNEDKDKNKNKNKNNK